MVILDYSAVELRMWVVIAIEEFAIIQRNKLNYIHDETRVHQT